MSQSLENQDANLDTAIENAFTGKTPGLESKETSSLENEEEFEVENSEEQAEEPKEVEETEEEIEEVSQADLDLLKQIRNPETRKAAIKALATAEKLIEAKAEEVEGGKPLTDKQVAKTTRQIAEEVLGDEFSLLPDKFFDLFDQLISDKLKPLADSQIESQKKAIQTDVDLAYSKLADKYDDFTAYETLMNNLATELPIKHEHSLEDHMLRLYKYAKAENPGLKPLTKVSSKQDPKAESDRKVKIRIQRNMSEPTVKGSTPEREVKTSTTLSLDEAITLAENQVSKRK